MREELCFGDSDVGVRGNQDLFRLSNIGPTLDDRRWKAGWNFRRKCLLDERNPACDVLWVIAEQDADGIFFLGNLPLQVGDLRIRGIEDLLGLKHIQLGGNAVVKPQLGKFDRIGLGLNRLTRDRELQIKLQQREVVGRNIADEGQCDNLACIFGSQELGAGGFVGAAQLAEEIELERRVGGQASESCTGTVQGFPCPAEIAIARNLRKQARTRNRKLGAGRIDAFRGELQIVVLFQCGANEFLQLRILKHLPPGKIGIRGSLRLKLRIVCQISKRIRSLNRRAMIVRAQPCNRPSTPIQQ